MADRGLEEALRMVCGRDVISLQGERANFWGMTGTGLGTCVLRIGGGELNCRCWWYKDGVLQCCSVMESWHMQIVHAGGMWDTVDKLEPFNVKLVSKASHSVRNF
jgi:hypothetical protein